MYAVVRTGGKQYRLEAGDTFEIEKIPGNLGEAVTFSEVLFVADDDKIKLGQPLVKGASVVAEIVAQKRGEKLKIFKKIRRHGKQLRKGHRQELTRIRVREIVAG
jgi:large subunit ribosomal protein L21